MPDACGWPGAPGRCHPTPGQPSAPAALPDDQHPWPPVQPPARFRDAAPVEYTRVEPTVVVELAVDAAADTVGVGPSGGTQPPSAEYEPTCDQVTFDGRRVLAEHLETAAADAGGMPRQRRDA
jgi:hypothetical protein